MARDAKRKKKTSARPPSNHVQVRQARPEDVPAIYECQRSAYATFPPQGICTKRQLRLQLEAFPEGQFVATIGERVVGYATSLIVQLDESSPWYSYSEITGGGTFSTHDPSGDTLYGADIAVHPDVRGRAIAGKLYEARIGLMKRFNLHRMVAGGRIPGYQKHAGRMTPEEYVDRVVRGKLTDSSLNAHLKAGYRVRAVHMGYMLDNQSLNYATFLELINPDYRPARRRIAGAPMKRPVRHIRVCAAQYQMRRIASWAEFEQQVEFFVSTAETYHCHFLLFPELFTAQLFSTMDPSLDSTAAAAELADRVGRYREMFARMAKDNGLFIIGGSTPVRSKGGALRNVAHLFTPTGNVYAQPKLHITPAERETYGIEPGDGLQVFETSHGRIAIVVCYDIEFPELARLLTLSGAEVIFVPFSTDERKAYLRVRYSAQARSVENIVYTVLSGNVGNLHQVESFLINYGEAVICTPSDFAFPMDAVAARAEFNHEAVAIADLDLGALEMVREVGSVRPLRERRVDLYELRAKTPVRVVRVK